MSSAALQSAPHQPTSLPALNPHSPSASPSNRQYSRGQSPSREARYVNRDHPSASPAPSSRRPSRRPSGNSANAASPIHTHPDQSQPSPMTSRTALASPAPVTASTDYEKQTSSRRRHDPPVAPPRSSSTQHGNPGSGATSSRRAARAEERATGSPRRAPGENGRIGANGYSDTGPSQHEETSSRTKRAASQHVPQETSHVSESSREHRQTVTANMPIRSRDQHATSTSSKQPSREASEVLNRVIVSQPEVDLERERERQGEAQPKSTPGSSRRQDDNDDDIASPPLHMHEAQDESRRSGRSRHDHSKREKSSRFGDYYLGNTIGEGEFGKVKLGWKQDGGVQVRREAMLCDA